jgi:hypothetical protein
MTRDDKRLSQAVLIKLAAACSEWHQLIDLEERSRHMRDFWLGCQQPKPKRGAAVY